jgi:hypothetical protein
MESTSMTAIEDLFTLFAINYDKMWLDTVPDPLTKQVKVQLWRNATKNFKPETIADAGQKILVKCETYPPRIGEFVKLCEEISKTNRYEEFDRSKLEQRAIDDMRATHDDKFRYTPENPQPPPSPLLAEYMAKERSEFKQQLDAKEWLKNIRENLNNKTRLTA